MKISNSKVWIYSILKIIIVLCLVVLTTITLNFILISPLQTSKIGTIMADLKQQDENVDILFLGSSRTYRGIDSPTLSKELNQNVFNIASDSVTYCSLYHLLVEICKFEKPKKVFLEFSITNFKKETGTEDFYIYNLLSGQNKIDYQKNANIELKGNNLFQFTNYLNNFSNGKFVENIAYKLSSDKTIGEAINTSRSFYVGNGFIFADKVINDEARTDFPGSYFNEGQLWNENSVNEQAYTYFFKIIDYCNENNIEITLFSPPYPYFIIERYIEEFTMFDSFIKETLKDLPNITILDFSKIKPEYLILSSSYFYNANHCNGYGAEKLAPTIIDILNALNKKTYDSNIWFFNDYDELYEAYQSLNY